jgi:hypothetical protein
MSVQKYAPLMVFAIVLLVVGVVAYGYTNPQNPVTNPGGQYMAFALTVRGQTLQTPLIHDIVFSDEAGEPAPFAVTIFYQDAYGVINVGGQTWTTEQADNIGDFGSVTILSDRQYLGPGTWDGEIILYCRDDPCLPFICKTFVCDTQDIEVFVSDTDKIVRWL